MVKGKGASVRAQAMFLLLAIAAPIATLTAGCGEFRERVCERGEYAARAVAAPKSGRVCVPNGREPPPGYERFPAGQTPTYLEDDPP